MTTKENVLDRAHYLGTYGPRVTKAGLLRALTVTIAALRAIIEAHKVTPGEEFGRWVCAGCDWGTVSLPWQGSNRPDCPNGLRAAAIAAHHLGIEEK